MVVGFMGLMVGGGVWQIIVGKEVVQMQVDIVHHLHHALMDAMTVQKIAFQLLVSNLNWTVSAIRARLAKTDTHVLCVPLANTKTARAAQSVPAVRQTSPIALLEQRQFLCAHSATPRKSR